ncbi:MAG: hypothetical protein K1X74_13085 [Pirellulales bacterium]|nr:hypothetical protein [Pirellulales bacterium]
MATVTPVRPSGDESTAAERYARLIDARIRATRRQVKSIELGGVLLAATVATLAYLFVFVLIDQWLVPGGVNAWGRLIFFLALVSGWVVVTVTRIVPLVRRQVNPVYAAQAIEEHRPSLKNSLINFLLLRGQQQELSPVVYEALESRAANDLSQVPQEGAVDHSRIVRWGYVLLGVVFVCCAYTLLSPKNPLRSVGRLMMPWSQLRAATRVTIDDLRPGNIQAFHDDVVDVSAVVQGLRSGEPVLVLLTTADGRSVDQPLAMQQPKGSLRYQAALPGGGAGLQQSVSYRIQAGDAKVGPFKIEVLMAPSILVEEVEYHYPDYTGLGVRRVAGQGDLTALEGTQIKVTARANESIASASIDFDCDGHRDSDMRHNDKAAIAEWVLALRPDRGGPEHESYQLRFVTAAGAENPRPIRHRIQVTPDQAPEIEIVEPVQESFDVPVNGEAPVTVSARDKDFALRSVWLYVEKHGQTLAREALLSETSPRGTAEFRGQYVLRPEALGLRPGDEALVFAEARDNKLPAANQATTVKLRLHVTAPVDPAQQKQPAVVDPAERDRARPEGGAQEEPSADEPGAGQREADADPQPPGEGEQPEEDAEATRDDEQPGERIDPDAEPGDAFQEILEHARKQEQQQPDGGQPPPREEQSPDNSGGEQPPAENQPDQQPPSAADQPSGGEEGNAGQGEQQQSSPPPESAESNPDSSSGGEQGQPDNSGNRQQGSKQQGSKQQGGNPSSPGNQSGGEPQSGGDASSGQQQGDNSGDGSPDSTQNGGSPASDQAGGNQPSQRKPAGAQPGDTSGSQPEGESAEGTPGEPSGGRPERKQGGAGDKQPGRTEQPQPGDQGAAEDAASDEAAHPRPAGDAEQETPGGDESSQNSKPGQGAQSAGRGDQRKQPAKPDPNASREANEPGGDPDHQSGNSGAGQSNQDQSGASSPQGNSKPRDKQPGGQQQPSSNEKPNEASSPSTSEKESNSEGGEAGDRSGGGKQGAGQNANSPGTGGAGQNTAADEGSSQAPGSGNGETSDQAGDKQPGSSASNSSGPKQRGQGEGAGQGDAGNSGDQSGGPSSGTSDQSGNQPGAPGNAPGSGAPGAQPAQNPGEGPQQRGPGGHEGTGNSATPTPPVRDDDQANLDYARQATDLALEHLRDQLAHGQPDQDLLDRLQWSRDDLERFLKRWQELKRAAKQAGQDGDAARQKLNEALRGLGLRPRVVQRAGRQAAGDPLRELRDSRRTAPPPDYAEQYEAYTEGTSRRRSGK